MNKFKIIGIGELLWDLFPNSKVMGGAVANLIYFTNILGAESFLATRVGEDDLGGEIINKAEQSSLDTLFFQRDPDQHGHDQYSARFEPAAGGAGNSRKPTASAQTGRNEIIEL